MASLETGYYARIRDSMQSQSELSKQGRGWTLTIPAKEVANINTLFQTPMRYLVLGTETGSEMGSEHYQGYVYFDSNECGRAVKRLFTIGTQLERSCRSSKQNMDYCKKDGNWKEWGDSGIRKAPKTLQNYLDTKHFSWEDKISKSTQKKRNIYDLLKKCDPKDVHLILQRFPEMARFIKTISRLALERKTRQYPAKVLYIWGESGIGKTANVTLALIKAGLSYYVKNQGKSFDGYKCQDALIFEDWKGEFPRYDFNQMCDAESIMLELKGYQLPFTSDFIILLSNKDPLDIYPKIKTAYPEEWAAWYRRCSEEPPRHYTAPLNSQDCRSLIHDETLDWLNKHKRTCEE